MKIEYLIVFKTSEKVCNSIKTFKNLLQADDLITISSNNIKYKNKDFKIIIGHGEITDKSQKFFQLEVNYEEADDAIMLLQELLKRIRGLVNKFGGEMNVIWDDLGMYNAKKSYPIICELENLLRKLISKFMLTNIGTNWTKETLPNEVRDAVSKSKRPNNNLLHNVDFIHLADFLFKPYQTKFISELFEKIKKCNSVQDLELEDLKTYIPKSNWQRYFKAVVECEDEFLLKRWSKLYELRCLVAHNNFLTNNEFNEILELTEQIEKPLKEALEKLNEIIIPDEEKEQIVENVTSNLNEAVGEYLNYWKLITQEISDAHSRLVKEANKNYTSKQQVIALIKDGHLKQEFLDELQPLGEFRNILVHKNLNSDFTKDTLEAKNNLIENFYNKRVFLEEPFF
ncbi:hypothetical protein IM793_21920 [Pedobacter sp. MR2016-19]|uniref:HEPN domain-containing protein n=1 Tax=Pedobacter sp. MR2016-19 TaxID=2780089 RepID=UPI001874BE12|nr:HEPN domain-containing protein [Pedobacter sp. MR2016-19]MBE5321831.1 hypothetical protein [Pedobacter sp. MR2016-19]